MAQNPEYEQPLRVPGYNQEDIEKIIQAALDSGKVVAPSEPGGTKLYKHYIKLDDTQHLHHKIEFISYNAGAYEDLEELFDDYLYVVGNGIIHEESNGEEGKILNENLQNNVLYIYYWSSVDGDINERQNTSIVSDTVTEL